MKKVCKIKKFKKNLKKYLTFLQKKFKNFYERNKKKY